MLGNTLWASYVSVILHIEIKTQTPRGPLIRGADCLSTIFPFSLSVRILLLGVLMCPDNKPHISASTTGRSKWQLAEVIGCGFLESSIKVHFVPSLPPYFLPITQKQWPELQQPSCDMCSNPNTGSHSPRMAE